MILVDLLTWLNIVDVRLSNPTFFQHVCAFKYVYVYVYIYVCVWTTCTNYSMSFPLPANPLLWRQSNWNTNKRYSINVLSVTCCILVCKCFPELNVFLMNLSVSKRDRNFQNLLATTFFPGCFRRTIPECGIWRHKEWEQSLAYCLFFHLNLDVIYWS